MPPAWTRRPVLSYRSGGFFTEVGRIVCRTPDQLAVGDRYLTVINRWAVGTRASWRCCRLRCRLRSRFVSRWSMTLRPAGWGGGEVVPARSASSPAVRVATRQWMRGQSRSGAPAWSCILTAELKFLFGYSAKDIHRGRDENIQE
jgi:hypothetical protein